MIRQTAELEAALKSAQADLDAKKAEQQVEVKLDFNLPEDEGLKPLKPLKAFTSRYFADIDEELALPSFKPSLVEGLEDE